MRIAIDARLRRREITGAGRYLAGLIPFLSKIAPDDEFVIIINEDCADLWRELPSNARLKYTNIPPAGYKQHIKMRKILKEIEPDVYHFPMFDMPHFIGYPSVITIFDLNAILFPDYFTNNKLFFRAAAILLHASSVLRADYIITSTQASRGQIIRYFPFTKYKTKSIILGYNANGDKDIFINNILNKYNINYRYILYVGAHRPHKNIEGLITAFGALKNNDDLHLVIAGAIDERFPEPRKMANGLGLDDRIHFMDYIPDDELLAFYKGAEAFVFPSFQEGFGYPLIEAMDMGAPVICSDIPVHREIVGDAGIYFNPKEPKDIADKIELILNDKNKRDENIRKGKERIKHFDWKRCAEETLEIYRITAQKRK